MKKITTGLKFLSSSRFAPSLSLKVISFLEQPESPPLSELYTLIRIRRPHTQIHHAVDISLYLDAGWSSSSPLRYGEAIRLTWYPRLKAVPAPWDTAQSSIDRRSHQQLSQDFGLNTLPLQPRNLHGRHKMAMGDTASVATTAAASISTGAAANMTVTNSTMAMNGTMVTTNSTMSNDTVASANVTAMMMHEEARKAAKKGKNKGNGGDNNNNNIVIIV
ncbi:MAG: hypothetical protein Q9190_005053 [Brigantiaea leucoxantha]